MLVVPIPRPYSTPGRPKVHPISGKDWTWPSLTRTVSATRKPNLRLNTGTETTKLE